MTQSYQEVKEKFPSALLILGIIIFPYIFAWFTLDKSYSQKVRYISLGWMIITILIIMNPKQPSKEVNAQNSKNVAVSQSDNRVEKKKTKLTDEELKVRIMSNWKEAIKEILIDPDSANFKKVMYVLAGNRTAFACGQVNSKNSLGGYTGYKKFITAGLKEYTFLEGETNGFEEWWKQVCIDGVRL